MLSISEVVDNQVWYKQTLFYIMYFNLSISIKKF